MALGKFLTNTAIGGVAFLFVAAPYLPNAHESGPVLARAAELLSLSSDSADASVVAVTTSTNAALRALKAAVQPLSHPRALEAAFHSYFAYKAAHPRDVRKPYLYFVDYGLPSTMPRGYVFDMEALRIVDGPIAVAHGRGSARGQYGVPIRFSNRPGSGASSLGLYVAQEIYDFHGNSGGHSYRSLGLRLRGVSGDFNDNARQRGVVAHGAPYVTQDRAGRSEGCPAMAQEYARRLIPKLANGGMVFLFAPDTDWLSEDPWVSAGES